MTIQICNVLNVSRDFERKTSGFSYSPLVYNHPYQVSKEFEHCIPTTKDAPNGKEWTCIHFFSKPAELTLR